MLKSAVLKRRGLIASTCRCYSSVALSYQPHSSPPSNTFHPNFYSNKQLDIYFNQQPTPLTLRQLLFYERHCNTERLLKSANYVRTELPIRIAHRIREFQNLPFIVGSNPHISNVYELYWQAFERIRKVPEIKTRQENEAFCQVLSESLDAHLVVIPELARGISECDIDKFSSMMSRDKLDQFMNATLRSRISRRVLAEHHLVLSKKKESIFNLCSSRVVTEKCIGLAKSHAMQYNGHAVPDIKVEGEDTEFTYVTDHIEYIIYQLLSNSIRHDTHRTAKNQIRVTLCSNETDVLFRISDKSGGMSKSKMENLWSYSNYNRFGNMNKIQQLEAKVNEHEHLMIRLGIGLPMSRVYAEYWNGDINIMSMDGYGTDAYVRIPRLGINNENISTGSILDGPIM